MAKNSVWWWYWYPLDQTFFVSLMRGEKACGCVMCHSLSLARIESSKFIIHAVFSLFFNLHISMLLSSYNIIMFCGIYIASHGSSKRHGNKNVCLDPCTVYKVQQENILHHTSSWQHHVRHTISPCWFHFLWNRLVAIFDQV